MAKRLLPTTEKVLYKTSSSLWVVFSVTLFCLILFVSAAVGYDYNHTADAIKAGVALSGFIIGGAGFYIRGFREKRRRRRQNRLNRLAKRIWDEVDAG